jgi:hypothetical protein
MRNVAVTFRQLLPMIPIMSGLKNGDSSSRDLVRNSSLYREFQAEREEILKHKWIESQKAGFDIGFERALTDWIMNHRTKWRKGRLDRAAEAEEILKAVEAASQGSSNPSNSSN